MCGVLPWWNVTLPSLIGHATTVCVVSRIARQQIALHVIGLAVRQHAELVAAVDEVHAAVRHVDVVKRHPAGDAALVEVATPIAFVLVPQVGALLPGGFARNWSYQNSSGLRISALANSIAQRRNCD